MTQLFFNLTPETILDSIDAIGFKTTGRCLPLNSIENRVYEVEIDRPEYVFKRRPEEVERDHVHEQMGHVHVQEAGCEHPVPLAALADGLDPEAVADEEILLGKGDQAGDDVCRQQGKCRRGLGENIHAGWPLVFRRPAKSRPDVSKAA